jgi:hypothetical protein
MAFAFLGGGMLVRKELTMIPCRSFAFYTLARDASFVALAAAMMMLAGFSFEPALAFKIGATVSLLFCLLLLARSYFLTDERFRRSEAWQSLRPEERPPGEDGRQFARAQFEELMLRFAKTSAGIAGILYGSALMVSASGTAIAGP